MTDEICGVTTADGDPCQNRAGDNGNCWIPSHNPDSDEENPHGRPTKLTKERQEKIASAIEQGSSWNEATRKNDVHPETARTWLNKGEEQNEGVYADFHGRLTRAKGQGEASYRSALMQIAIENNDTATLMTMLKQRYPESWGDVDRGDQAGAEIQIFDKAPENIDELVDALQE